MSTALTAHDLWPLVLKLSHDERVLLAKLALRAAAEGDVADAAAYRASPPSPDEFTTDDEPLAGDADDGSEFYAPR